MTGRRHIVVHEADTVATVLDTDTQATRLMGGLPCAAGVPFGHKVALCAMPGGSAVVKYGVTIGRATQDIAPGDHVHVHNCR